MPAKKNTTSPKPKPAPRRVSSEDDAVPVAATRYSAFTELGFKKTIDALCEEIRELYLEDQVPWILGYSGGKDSTATLQLIWLALQDLPEDSRTKTVHVISTDTMVENPIVSSWVQRSLEVMSEAAKTQGVPIRPKLLRPQVEESFWVNLIGRGYHNALKPSVTRHYLLAA